VCISLSFTVLYVYELCACQKWLQVQVPAWNCYQPCWCCPAQLQIVCHLCFIWAVYLQSSPEQKQVSGCEMQHFWTVECSVFWKHSLVQLSKFHSVCDARVCWIGLCIQKFLAENFQKFACLHLHLWLFKGYSSTCSSAYSVMCQNQKLLIYSVNGLWVWM